ncbi:MAG TPA: DHA2 family efflux MFS transporter permease subunit [Candidatus Acidoferrales bacterium]|jgi:DHA2 family multidrug resistance protein|nr:DHA2 family efflux MFS transporter permease subunit [Candidatus Acidoferrales bacterium]
MSSTTAEYAQPVPEINPWLIAVTVMVATFMEVLDTSVANVSLPHIAGNLSAGLDESTWVLTSYLVSNAIVLPLTGWFSSIFGRKKFLIACVVIFTISSFLCGMAPSLPMLVLFRVIQGAGGGGMQPASQAILVDSFPRNKQGMAMAIYGMGVVVAPTIGPTLGGWITDDFSWRWIFFLNVPIGVISVIMISLLIIDPHSDSHSGLKGLRSGFKIDFLGLGFLGLGLGLLQVVLDKGERDDWFGSPFIVWSTVIAVSALVALIVWEFITDHPVVDLRLFKDRNFAISTFMMYILGFVLYSTTVLLPLLLQTLMGYTAMRSGIVLLPGGLVLLAILPSVGWLLGRFEPRWIVVTGLCVMALGLYFLSHFTLNAGESNAIDDWIFSRAGTAFLFVPINVMAFYFVPPGKMNNASGLINLARNIGASTGISFVTTMLDRRAQFHQDVLSSNMQAGSPMYQRALTHITHEMIARGMDAVRAAQQAHATIYLQLQRQAMMLSFVDNFWIMSVVCIAVIPLMFIMKKRQGGSSARVPVH